VAVLFFEAAMGESRGRFVFPAAEFIPEVAMTILARPYMSERDLEKMESILTAGRKAANGAYYVHVGDLRWWMFYTDSDPRQGRICLWEWDADLMGWSLLSPNWRMFDVFVRPEMRGRALEAKIMMWAEECLSRTVQSLGGEDIRMEVNENDALRIRWLEMRGFTSSLQFMWIMSRSLDDPLPETRLPPGYHVRSVAGEGEVRARAAASHGAFGSSLAFEDYWKRMLRFMRSPVYRSDLDLVTVAPDGRFASFCIVWPDPVTKVGLFEPVGTHPDFQRKGLGKAVVVEGLRRLKVQGMKQAIVCAEHDNLSAQKLYESAGFRTVHKLYTFEKPI
jgi:ribosomal protein S18 acetylase RimI-like enzyme